MKCLWMCGILCAATWCRGMELPDELGRLAKLEEARELAKREGEALIFLKVNPANSQEYVEEAVEEYVREFKRYGAMVLVPLNVKTPNLPETAAKAFDAMSGGYPRLVVIDAESDEVIVKVPYVSQKDRDDELKEYRRTVHRYLQDNKSRRSVPIPKPLY